MPTASYGGGLPCQSSDHHTPPRDGAWQAKQEQYELKSWYAHLARIAVRRPGDDVRSCDVDGAVREETRAQIQVRRKTRSVPGDHQKEARHDRT